MAYTYVNGVVTYAPESSVATVTTPRYIYAPGEITAAATSAYSVKIKWSESSNADGYALKRYNPSTGQWDILLQTADRDYTHNTWQPNTRY